MIPSNGLQELFVILGKARIDQETLHWVGIAEGDFHRKLEECREQVSEHQKVVQQLFYLTQEFYHEYYKIEKIEDGEFPTLSDDSLNGSPSLREIISDVLEKSGLGYIDPQQFFNYTVQKRRLKDSNLASKPKASKWKMAKLILSHSQKVGKLDYHYFLPEMSSEAAEREYKRWSLGFANAISDFATDLEVKWFKSINKGKQNPVFVLPGVSAKNLNQLFLDSRNDEDIISALTFFTRNDTSTEEVELSIFADDKATMLDKFNLIKGLFPRIKGHWNSLDYSVRYFVYQCFTNIRTNGFKVLHQRQQIDRSELPTAFVHGDEWGANFHLSKERVLIPIDFDDLLTNEVDESRNSHLYRRIWMRTDSGRAMTRYVFNINKDLTQNELDAHLDVSRSMGRLFCSLIQYWMCEYPKNEITEAVEKRISSMIETINPNLDQFGWFWLSFIDWALEWGENSRREENSKNKFEHYKFILSKIAGWYSHEKTYPSRYESDYYVEFIRWLKNTDPKSAEKRQQIKHLFGLKNLTSQELEYELRKLRWDDTAKKRKSKINFDNVDAEKLVKLLKTRNPLVEREFIELPNICDIHDLDFEWIEDGQIIFDGKLPTGGYVFLEELEHLNLLSFCVDVLKTDDEKMISNFEQSELHSVIRDLWNGSRV